MKGKEMTRKAIPDGIFLNPGSKHKAEPLPQLEPKTKKEMDIRQRNTKLMTENPHLT